MSAVALYSRRVDDALALAADAFRARERKGSQVPYLSHLLQVMVTVMEHGGDEEQIVAAVLHDYLEDIEGASEDELRVRFGPRVAKLVLDLSDTTEHPKPPWHARKRAYLAHLTVADHDLKLVSAADKLHNARCLVRDFEAIGDALWARFSASKEDTLWYYRAVVRALAAGWDHPLVATLGGEVAKLHTLAGAPYPAAD